MLWKIGVFFCRALLVSAGSFCTIWDVKCEIYFLLALFSTELTWPLWNVGSDFWTLPPLTSVGLELKSVLQVLGSVLQVLGSALPGLGSVFCRFLDLFFWENWTDLGDLKFEHCFLWEGDQCWDLNSEICFWDLQMNMHQHSTTVWHIWNLKSEIWKPQP